ncbi:hypothetical protein TKK_0016768 [Trichogramma kaykai]|uniref:Uncharacterized protein n=1 Tax=Trichogramma kaykai TaxID=54128 RepID=A0ABD2W464_9HYME
MSAWGKIENHSNVSFEEITSEQLAHSLQEKEIKKHNDLVLKNTAQPELAEPDIIDPMIENDEAIAHTLQAEINQDHDLRLKREEEIFNRNSKVQISYDNFRMGIGNPIESVIDDDEKEKDIDRFVAIEKVAASIPACGYKKVGQGEDAHIITKHDPLINSQINACRVLEFRSAIETGDTGKSDIRMDNKVFNVLRKHDHDVCSREKAKAHLQKPQSKSKSIV